MLASVVAITGVWLASCASVCRPAILGLLLVRVVEREIITVREVAAVQDGRRSYRERIIQDPAIMVGKPVVKGTRIPVERVLAHLADNPDVSDLFEAFPRLTPDDVRACLEYAREAVESQRAMGASDEVAAAPR